MKNGKKIILIGPRFILNKIYKLNNFFPGGSNHLIFNHNDDHDFYHAVDNSKSHILLSSEEVKGEKIIRNGNPNKL